jgi:hypothetical protein
VANTIKLTVTNFEVIDYMEKVFGQACPLIVPVKRCGTPTVGTQIRSPYAEVTGEVVDKWAISSSVKSSGVNEQ